MLQLLLLTMILLQDQSKNKRVLVLYTYNADNPAYLQQIKLLAADGPGLTERDIIIQKIIFSDITASKFKNQHIKAGFTFILIGKDGSKKFRSNKTLTLKQLYGLIDAMPMRIEEIRKKEK